LIEQLTCYGSLFPSKTELDLLKQAFLVVAFENRGCKTSFLERISIFEFSEEIINGKRPVR
jgi:hypothetical protein